MAPMEESASQPVDKGGHGDSSWPQCFGQQRKAHCAPQLGVFPVCLRKVQPSSLKLLCYGDSNTAGFNAGGQAYDPYARTMAEELRLAGTDCSVSVCGLSGLTAREMVVQSSCPAIQDAVGVVGQGIEVLLANQPDLVILMMGTNDIGKGMHPKAILDDICLLHARCHARGIPTVAIAPPTLSQGSLTAARDELAALLDRWARVTPMVHVCADIQDLVCRQAASTFWDHDELHLSPSGSAALGGRLAREVLRWLAGRRTSGAGQKIPASISPDDSNHTQGAACPDTPAQMAECARRALPAKNSMRPQEARGLGCWRERCNGMPVRKPRLSHLGSKVTVRPRHRASCPSGDAIAPVRHRGSLRTPTRGHRAAGSSRLCNRGKVDNAAGLRRHAEVLASPCISSPATPLATVAGAVRDSTVWRTSQKKRTSFVPLPRPSTHGGSHASVPQDATNRSLGRKGAAINVNSCGALTGSNVDSICSMLSSTTLCREFSLRTPLGSQTARRSSASSDVDSAAVTVRVKPGWMDSCTFFRTQDRVPPHQRSPTLRRSHSACGVRTLERQSSPFEACDAQACAGVQSFSVASRTSSWTFSEDSGGHLERGSHRSTPVQGGHFG